MTPLKNHIIIKAALDQRETLTYGTLKLFIPKRNQLNANGRESNPTLCEVIAINSDYKHIQVGDILILGHNSISNKGSQISVEDNIATCSLGIDKWVLGKLNEQGDLQPLCGNVTAKRMEQAPASSIIITPDAYKKTEANKVDIIASAPELDYEQGDIAAIWQYADYEIFWQAQGEQRSAIIIYHKDIVGVYKEEGI